jgi:ketosteroid isomerase-like protein
MPRSAIRATVLAISLVLALVAGSALSLHGRTAPAMAQQIAPSDRSAVISEYFSAVNSGDVDRAAALFADDAIFIGSSLRGNCSQSVPCTDPAAIHEQITRYVTSHDCRVLRSVTVNGAVVTGQSELRSDNIRQNGVDHLREDFIALVPAGHIEFWANLIDLADPDTALNHAINLGIAQPVNPPIPNPATPCAGVSGA